MQVLDNPMVTGRGYYTPKPDAICETCGAELSATVLTTLSEQLSASRKYCENCIDKLDTPENRYKWLDENGLQAKFLEWLFANENEREFDAEQRATAKLFVDMWRAGKKGGLSDFDGYLETYINDESGYAYTQWLLDTN